MTTPQPRDLKQRYVLYEKLGEGGIAVVYRAKHLQLDREVALKYIKLDATSDSAAKRLRDEARAIARLNHPNILNVYDFEAEEGANRFFMAMEYLPDGDLLMQFNKRQAAENPFSLPDIVTIVKSVASGLGFAHLHGIVHRDVKLSNIFVTQDKRVVIGDFGLAKHIDAPTEILPTTEVDLKLEQTLQGVFIGTPTYLSPEQIQGITIDHRTDIYALGIVFFQLVMGYAPYSSETLNGLIMHHLQTPVPDVAALRPDLPALIPVIIQKCLAKQPKDRYETMQELIVDLTALQMEWSESEGSFTRTSQPIPVTALPRRKTRLRWAALLVLLLLVGVGAFMVLNNEDEAEAELEIPPPAQPGEFLVIVGGMYDEETRIDLGMRIKEYLEADRLNLALQGSLRVETLTNPITSAATAQEIGERADATLIIWGDSTTASREIVVSRVDPLEDVVSDLHLSVPRDDIYDQRLLAEVPELVTHYTQILTLQELVYGDNMYATLYLLFSLTRLSPEAQLLAATPFDQRLMEAISAINAGNYAEADQIFSDLLLTTPNSVSLHLARWSTSVLRGEAELSKRDAFKIEELTGMNDFSRGLLILTYYLFGEDEPLFELAEGLGAPTNSAINLAYGQYYLLRIHQGDFAGTEADMVAIRQQMVDLEMPNAEQGFIETLVFLQQIKGDEVRFEELLPTFLENRQNEFIREAVQFFQRVQPDFISAVAFSQGGNNAELTDELLIAGVTYDIGLQRHPTDYLLNWRMASLQQTNKDYQAAYDFLEIANENKPVPFPIARFEQALLVNKYGRVLENAAPICQLLNEARVDAETDPVFYAVLLDRIDDLRGQACSPVRFG